MGKKGGWFNAVKKAFSPESKVRIEEVMILPFVFGLLIEPEVLDESF